MALFAQVIPNTVKASLIFAAAAIVVALVEDGVANEAVLRVISGLPPLLALSAAGVLAVNVVAAVGGSVIGGSSLVAAVVAAVAGWFVAGGGFALLPGFSEHAGLQPTLVVALAAPWLLDVLTD